MPVKINIGTKEGLTYRLELEENPLNNFKIGDEVEGKIIDEKLEGYKFIIKGGSDKSGFPHYSEVEGPGLKRVLLSYGFGMHKRPKGDKKINKKPKGMRLRKTVRGNTLSEATAQINLIIVEEGKEKLEKIFPDQNKKESPAEAEQQGAQEGAEAQSEQGEAKENSDAQEKSGEN